MKFTAKFTKGFDPFATIGALAFAAFFYRQFGFVFGQDNNTEELPAIFQLAGLADYPLDFFVHSLADHFNPATPYFRLWGASARFTGFGSLPLAFFLIHLAVLLTLYFSLRGILKSISGLGEMGCWLAIGVLPWVDHPSYLLPNSRVLFFTYLDPESLGLAGSLLALALHLRGKFKAAACALFFATLAHPLYAIPMLGALLVDLGVSLRSRSSSVIAAYLSAVVPYSLFVWWKIRPGIPLIYEPQKIVELVRAAHHYHVLKLSELPSKAKLFFSFSIFGVASSYFFRGTEAQCRAVAQLRTILLAMLGYLFVASAISQFVHIDLLSQLTPYRTGVMIVPLAWLIGLASVWSRAQAWIRPPSPVWPEKIKVGVASLILVVIFAASFKGPVRFRQRHAMAPERQAAIDWIRAHTQASDLVLNYSDLDIRTECLRSNYFGFRTVPLNPVPQVDWYRQLLIYYDVPPEIPGSAYERVAEYWAAKPTVDVAHVLRRLEETDPVSVLVLQAEVPTKAPDLKPAFESGGYRIFLLDPRR